MQTRPRRTDDEIVPGSKERRRAQVLHRVVSGLWSRGEVAMALGVCERQVRRLLAAYEAHRPEALLHGNRGRVPANRLAAVVRERVVTLALGAYAGCND